MSHDICFRCMVSQQPSGGRTSPRVSRLLPVADRSVTTSCIHRMARHVNSVPRHDARLSRNLAHRLARPLHAAGTGMPSSSHDSPVLAHPVPEQRNCLDSEHTTGIAARVAHSYGTRRRRRTREHTRKMSMGQGSDRLLPTRHISCRARDRTWGNANDCARIHRLSTVHGG